MKPANQEHKRQQTTAPVDTSNWLAVMPVIRPFEFSTAKQRYRQVLDKWMHKTLVNYKKHKRPTETMEQVRFSSFPYRPFNTSPQLMPQQGFQLANLILKEFIAKVRWSGRTPHPGDQHYGDRFPSSAPLEDRWRRLVASRYSNRRFLGKKISPRDVLALLSEPEPKKREAFGIMTPQDALNKTHAEAIKFIEDPNNSEAKKAAYVDFFRNTRETLDSLVRDFADDIGKLVPEYDGALNKRDLLYINALTQSQGEIEQSVREARANPFSRSKTARATHSTMQTTMQTKLKRRMNLKSSPVESPSVDVFANIFRGAPQ